MSIIIGGSSSSGSSLLQTILNRHSEIYCGPETSLFAKKELFRDWSGQKHRILAKGFKALRNPSWYTLNGIHLVDEFGVWTERTLEQLLSGSDSFTSFTKRYFGEYLNSFNKKIWIEKTPSNSINFNPFLDTFSDGRVIHMVRNPYDTIASLVRRGHSPYSACGLYLCNAGIGARSRKRKEYLELKYEDLVMQPLKTLQLVCDHINVRYEDSLLDNQVEGLPMENKLSGWKYDANDPIGSGSIGRFDQLNEAVREEIITISANLLLKDAKEGDPGNIKDLTELFGYPFKETEKKPALSHRLEQITDMIQRTIRTYPTHLFNYPVKFSK